MYLKTLHQILSKTFSLYEGGPRIGGFCPQSSDLFESAGNSENTGQKPPIRGPPSYVTPDPQSKRTLTSRPTATPHIGHKSKQHQRWNLVTWLC